MNNTDPGDTPPSTEKPDSVRHGLGMLVLLHMFQLPLAAFSAWIVIGLSQLIYVLPFTIYLWRDGRKQSVKGMLIGAGITFLLNTACFGIVISTLSYH